MTISQTRNDVLIRINQNRTRENERLAKLFKKRVKDLYEKKLEEQNKIKTIYQQDKFINKDNTEEVKKGRIRH